MLDTSARTSFVFVQPHLRLGGAETQTAALANGLVARGHRCAIILHSRTGELLQSLDSRIEVHDLGGDSHARLPLITRRARRLLADQPPSLVVARLWSSILLVGSMANGLQKHRYVFFEDLDPRDHATYVRFGRLKQWLVRRVYRRFSGRLAANTHHVADAMVSVYGLPHRPQVLECGVDRDLVIKKSRTAPPGAHQTRSALRLATVGSLIGRKGLLELRDSLAALGEPIQWVLIGDGPLAAPLAEHPVDNETLEVVILGSLANPFAELARSDALIHGARSESFGVVVVEAIALGLPVLANHANGPKEIQQALPQAAVKLFDLDDLESVREALKDLPRLKALASQAASRDLGPFDLGQCLHRWERFAVQQAGDR